MSAQEVQKCLQKAGNKYIDSAKKDIIGALQEFKDLQPINQDHLFTDGKRRTAFCLRGTIPVYYKGSCYNIPVSIFLWQTHPYYAPICFVNPTATMVIKESEHVNKEGRIYLPYLNEWRFPGHDLNGLLNVMSMIFQEKCPVFARSSSTTSTQQPTPTTTSSNSQPTPYPATPSMPTPYPATSTAGITPYPQTNVPYPIGAGAGYNPYMNVPNTTPSAVPYPSAGMTPYPSIPARPPAPTNRSTSMAGIGQDTIRDSLLSALNEKLRVRVSDFIGTGSAELASIQSTERELRDGQLKLKRMVEELESQRNSLQTAVELYSSKKAELSKALQDAGGTEAPPIDEAINASTPLHRQIVTNYAKDLTCDDVIYSLGQSLKKGNLTLSDYLRRVRDVSREQFIYRATMQKCRRVAGLPI